jgi:phage terminase large subunit-like protein
VFVFQQYQSRLQFGFMQTEDHKFRYQSAEFQKINWDEATQFPWSQYSYLRSRLRRTTSVPVPPSLACATNPGGVGHNWFYRWFIKGDGINRIFVPAKLDDNPHLERDEYRDLLKDLDEITRRQLLNGEWVVDESGRPFKSEYFDQCRYVPGESETRPLSRKMFIDCAISDKNQSAFNAIVIMELMSDYRLRVVRVWREKTSFPRLVQTIRQFGEDYNYDGLLDGIVVEDKANGPAVYQTIRDGNNPHLARIITAFMPKGSKGERYHQAALWCERACVELPFPRDEHTVLWLFPFEEELYEILDGEGEYLDQADAFSMGVIYMEHYVSRGYWYRQRLQAQPAAL